MADWGTDKRQSKVRGPGRKKAVTVTGPYVVYMLRRGGHHGGLDDHTQGP